MPHGRTVLIINKLKGNLMRNLVVLSLSSAALFIPLVSSAMTIHGDIHPERYTFFLTQEGSNQLKQANDRIAKNPAGLYA